MNIDLNDITPEDAEQFIRAEIESRGLDPETMRIVVDNIKHDKATRAMSFRFHFAKPDAPP
ncbi:hypothetical protein [Pseudomonas extremaustralis]|uniref:hypothetical protein n=1 Tax=Pseudomonas extremaustralis TaxID=359110 RepID=UPI002AA8DE20|nr:hypothetical protein [Pseudomonas extremaustralis]